MLATFSEVWNNTIGIQHQDNHIRKGKFKKVKGNSWNSKKSREFKTLFDTKKIPGVFKEFKDGRPP